MGAGTIVLNALKSVGKWVAQNPGIVKDAADKVINLKTDDKVNQLGAAVLELDQKINSEMVLVRRQLRDMKIILSVMGIVLISTIITIILLVI